MILARTTFMDGELVNTRNTGVAALSPPVSRTTTFSPVAVPKFVAPIPIADPFFPPPVPEGHQYIPPPPTIPVPAETPLPPPPAPTEGTHGSGPAIVEQAARSIASPAPAPSSGPPQQLAAVKVEGTPGGNASIPWVPILIVLGVTVAIIVAVKVFGKRV